MASFFLEKIMTATVSWICIIYRKCSKISNTSCLPNRPRQIAQTQIRLLLKKQADQGLPCLLF